MTITRVETANQIKLTIELVPSTCWYDNVRSQVSRADWELCKFYVRQRSGDRCEICGGRGPRWPVECHEIWEYDAGVQRLVDLIALCPSCHEVKHMGRAEATGSLARALRHLMKVNGWTERQAQSYTWRAFETWAIRSTQDWDLDISVLTDIVGP